MDHTHCLSPARALEADAAVTSSSYARLFPDLPAFSADEAFLYALGRAGGLCDCGDEADDEASLGTEAAGWPFFGQFVAHDITADRSLGAPVPRRSGAAEERAIAATEPRMPVRRRTGRTSLLVPAERSGKAAHRQRADGDVLATAKAPRSSAIRGTIRTCSCRRCTSRSSTPTTRSSTACAPPVSRRSPGLRTRPPENCAGTIRRWSCGSSCPR